MEASVSRRDFQHFRAPQTSLGDLDADVAAQLLAVAGDVALVVDREGVIRDVAFGSEDLSREGYSAWIGQPWIETVTIESRAKVEALLKDAGAKGLPMWRQVNHPSARGADVPVRYSAVRVDPDGRVVAIGRDLRAVAVLQQRLVDAQQAMEREYGRLRHAETRYRLLFQIASEPVIIVDATSQKVVEANPAAMSVLGRSAQRLVGQTFGDLFHADAAAPIQDFLARTRTMGSGGEVTVRLLEAEHPVVVSGSLFRQENASHLLVRLSAPANGTGVLARRSSESHLLKAIASAPDGFVVTDPDGLILNANRAFLDLAQVASEEQARGQSLASWLGRPGVDLNVIMASLRQHGSLRLYGTTLRGEFGGSAEIEVSAVSVPSDEQPCLGFMIRDVGRRFPSEARMGRQLPRSVDQLTELVGRVPLKDLVRETTDVVEQLCIEAALTLTGDNRASAAEILGLSRQSLYVKLRRYGLGDLEPDVEH